MNSKDVDAWTSSGKGADFKLGHTVAEASEDFEEAARLLDEIVARAPGDSDLAEKARVESVRLEGVREKWQTPEGQKQVRYEAATARHALQAPPPLICHPSSA